MVVPGMLQNPSVRKWLEGIEPAWTLLDYESFSALGHPPSPTAGPIRLAADLGNDEIQQSAVTRNALVLLSAAASDPGLKLTQTGNLSRSVVAELRERFTWPGFDDPEAFRFHKVINEPDFLPLFFVRHVAMAGKLLRRYKGHLKITTAGREMLKEPHQPALQAVLFHVALWRMDLAYLSRGLLHGWPQNQIGVVLWGLSIAANDWQPPGRMARMCAIPIHGVLDAPWDMASHAMEATVLRPLRWFGLLDYRQIDAAEVRFENRHLYRKTPLFDRFLSFDVRFEADLGPRH